MKTSPRFNFSLFSLAFTVLCVLPFGHVWADESRQLELNRFYWSNGRGLLQHYHSIKSGPWMWTANLSEARVEVPQAFENCYGVAKATNEVFDQCAILAVGEMARLVANQQKVLPEAIERMNIFSAVFENQNQTYKWQSWLRLSSASILAGEYKFADQLLKNAKKSADLEKSQGTWVSHRLAIFEQGLKFLLNEKRLEKESEKIRELTSNADSGSLFLAKEVGRLSQGKTNPNLHSKSDRNPDTWLNELARQRWILRQDRDELVTLRSLLSESGLGIEFLRRMNSLLSQHQFQSREWQAIVSVLAGIASKVEYLERNQGLSLALEEWLGNSEPQQSFLSYDDDSFLVRQHHIQKELTRIIAGVVEQMSAELSLSVEKKQADLILERLRGMSSTAGEALSRLPVSEVQQQTDLLKSKIRQLDESLRRLHAMVAAIDFVRLPEQDSLSAIGGYLSEIGTLRADRLKLFSEYVSQTVSLIPHTMTSIALLNQKTDYLRRTLNDVRTLVAGQERRSLEGTQAGFFFLEANQLLDRISIESRQHVALKASEAGRIASGFKTVDAGVAALRGDLGKMMAESSSQLRLPLTKILSALELELHKRERSLELEEQLAHAENKRRISADKAKLEWQRDRIGDSRRIRSENLEWRSGR